MEAFFANLVYNEVIKRSGTMELRDVIELNSLALMLPYIHT